MGDLVVSGFFPDLLHEQVEQAGLADHGLAVVLEAQPAVQVRVVAKPLQDEVVIPLVRGKDLGIRSEAEEGAVLGLGILPFLLGDELPFLEDRLDELALPVADHLELRGEGVHRLGADAVQTDGKLEHVVVELPARVHLADAVDDLAQGDAAAVVTDGHGELLAHDLDDLAFSHDELIHAVVDDFLQEDVDPVHGIGAVPEPPDVHPRAKADVLECVESLDCFLVVADLCLSHGFLIEETWGRTGLIEDRPNSFSQFPQGYLSDGVTSRYWKRRPRIPLFLRFRSPRLTRFGLPAAAYTPASYAVRKPRVPPRALAAGRRRWIRDRDHRFPPRSAPGAA